MKNNFNKMIDRFFFWVWAIIWFIATVCGIAILLENINFSKIGDSTIAGLLFATFSFYYVMYKFSKKDKGNI